MKIYGANLDTPPLATPPLDGARRSSRGAGLKWRTTEGKVVIIMIAGRAPAGATIAARSVVRGGG